MKKNSSKEKVVDDERFEHQIFKTLVECGHVIPETEAEVQSVMERFPQTKELPASLREASDVLGRIKTNPKIRSDKIVSLPQNQFSETGQELARAARKGGAIPARVEEKMRHNRDQADAENRRKSKIH